MKYEDIQAVNAGIKTTDVKGKAYAEVPERVQAFRKLYPEGRIETEILSLEGGVCVMKATAWARDAEGSEWVLATGTAYEKEDGSYINKTSYIENCETSAVGRALGFIGIGSTDSIASAEEVQNAINNQNRQPEKVSDREARVLHKMLDELGTDVPKFLSYYHVKTVEAMNKEQYAQACKILNKRLEERDNAVNSSRR